MRYSLSPTPYSLFPFALLTLGVVYLGFFVDRTHALSVLLGYGVAFGGYGLLLAKKLVPPPLKWLIILGVALRVALVFAFPRLSDDVYRFLWDGYLLAAGEDPFQYSPDMIMAAARQTNSNIPGITEALFTRLNSPEYFTIYPPVAQGVFSFSVWAQPESWYGAAVVMKLFILACELGTLLVLHRLLTDERSPFANLATPALLLYWLNPLVLVEITGNLHFEGAMVFFLVLALWFLVRSQWVWAGVSFAASVASKLLPLLLLPFLLKRFWLGSGCSGPGRSPGGTKSSGRGLGQIRPWFGAFLSRPFYGFSLSFALFLVLFFLPLFSSAFLSGLGSSLDLYFRKFEFNASLYYLVREAGYHAIGWNIIAQAGPALGQVAAVSILLYSLLARPTDWRGLPRQWLLAFTIYLACATTVHPWYLCVPLVLSVFTRLRYAVVWSALICLTYVSYTTVPYKENLWLVAVEYVLVYAFLVYELIAMRPGPHPKPSSGPDYDDEKSKGEFGVAE